MPCDTSNWLQTEGRARFRYLIENYFRRHLFLSSFSPVAIINFPPRNLTNFGEELPFNNRSAILFSRRRETNAVNPKLLLLCSFANFLRIIPRRFEKICSSTNFAEKVPIRLCGSWLEYHLNLTELISFQCKKKLILSHKSSQEK